MQVSDPNNVKIYNLSAGKSLPEWLTERKRRALLKKNVDIKRRIELIQDFDMPAVSNCVKVSSDGQFVLATGIYKPRVKCFDVNNLSLKFERCFDSEVVTFEILSEDYSKLVFLHCDRYVEFHAAHGKYYRLRIPRFGRDMQYHYPSCELFIVGASNEIYRLNLERGQFLQSLTTEASGINRCTVNPVHHLLLTGTQEGRIEAWDPRTRNKAGSLDCAFHCVTEQNSLGAFPSITAVKCQGGLTIGVGTATGQVLLYDIRSNKPLLVKDHMYGLPIRDVEFHNQMDLVYSMDSSVVKIWEKGSGKLYTSIEAQSDFNNLCVVPDTGMLFIANESTKMQTYYIPSLGPAPRWCSFLDNLTEELEESNFETVYDDYKFITEKELDELGLAHLKGTNLLRAYMHGYFIDIRLYRKARDVAQPFAFDEYKKKKIRQKIEEERTNRVLIQKLPKVNKDLALKLMDSEADGSKKKSKKSSVNILKDDRFKDLFSNSDFEVDKDAEEYRLLNPVISQLDKTRKKELNKQLAAQAELEARMEEEEVEKGEGSSDDSASEEASSDDERQWVKEVQKQHKMLKREAKQREWNEEKQDREEEEANTTERVQRNRPKFIEFQEGVEFKGGRALKKKINRASLGERLQNDEISNVRMIGSGGSREMTFSTKKPSRGGRSEEQIKRHREERKRLSRPAGKIGRSQNSKFSGGKRGKR